MEPTPPNDPERIRNDTRKAAFWAVFFSIGAGLTMILCLFGGIVFFAASICSGR